jgi:hypothetical protein
MVVVLRASQIYSQPAQPAKRGKPAKPAKPGRLPTSKSHFHEVIAPKLEKVALGEKAVGYTERSLDKLIEQGIEAAEQQPKRPRAPPRISRSSQP